MTSPHDLTTHNLRAHSVSGGAITFAAQATRFLCTFGSQIFLARILSPVDFGLIALVAPVLSLLAVFADMGLLQALIQKQDLKQDQINTTFWSNVIISLLLSFLAAAASPIIYLIYKDPRVISITIILSASLFLNGLSQVHAALMARKFQFVRLALIELTSQLTAIGVGLASAIAGFGYWSLVWSQIANVVLSTILLWIFSDWRPSSPKLDKSSLAIFAFGAHVMGANLSSFFYVTADSIIVGVALGETSLGLYDRAYKLATQPLSQITGPVGRVALPVLSALVSQETRYRSAFKQLVQCMLLISAPAFVFATMRSSEIVNLVFGPKWADMAPAFSWICFASILVPLNASVFWLFVSQGRVNTQMRAIFFVSIVNICSFLIGVRFGVEGVAKYSALSSWLLQTPFLLLLATRSGPVNLRQMIEILHPFFFFVPVSMFALFAFGHGRGPVGVLVNAFILVLCFIGCLGINLLSPSSRPTIVTLCSTLLEKINQFGRALLKLKASTSI
jgi:PST family polysaccharide transporter